jgi:DNA-binding transcriptional LysR family regulator
MHIEKLKYFVDLYECKNFTETARRNFISQASISQYITSLEKEFDVVFFDRAVNPIQATLAGKLFYNNAKLLLKQYEETKTQIQNAIEIATPKLTLAYTSLNDLKLLLPFVTYLKKKSVLINIELEKVDCKDIESYLTKGIADLGLSFADEFPSDSLSRLVIKSGNYNALVSEGHPLFNNDFITLNELYKYPLLMLSEESMGESFLVMKERSLEDGYFPNIARTVDDFEEGFFYILSEQLIGFATEDYNLERLDGVIRSIPIEGSKHTYEIVLAYQQKNDNQAIQSFVQQLKTYLS